MFYDVVSNRNERVCVVLGVIFGRRQFNCVITYGRMMDVWEIDRCSLVTGLENGCNCVYNHKR